MTTAFSQGGAFAARAFSANAYYTKALWMVDPPPLGLGSVLWTPVFPLPHEAGAFAEEAYAEEAYVTDEGTWAKVPVVADIWTRIGP